MTNSPVGQPPDLKVWFADDPDPERAGQGLASAPLVREVLNQADLNCWLMSPAEQVAMIYLLEHRRPRVGIEIGTRFGGSLQVLSKYSEHVYSLDIDPEVPRRLAGKYSNVSYLTGPSSTTLPQLLSRLQEENAEVGFVLVDGDHTAAGVMEHIDNLLRYRPIAPLYVVMHDSFNPECRRGLRMSRWADCPYVHAVELDFVVGTVYPSPAFRGQPWGGLALGILLPESREGRFEVTALAELAFERSGLRGHIVSFIGDCLRRVVKGSPG